MPGSDRGEEHVIVADTEQPGRLLEQVREALSPDAMPSTLTALKHPADLDAHLASRATTLLAPPDLAASLLAKLPALRWVQSTFAGVAPIVAAMRTHPNPTLLLTAAKGMFGPRMAEYVFGWVLGLERRVLDYEALKQSATWQRLPWRDLGGRTMTLLGTGSIGTHLAGVARGFGLRVRGVSRRGRPVEGIDDVLPIAALPEALAETDYLVASVPDTPQTRGLLDAAALAHLPPEAIVINVGRGSLIVEDDLVAALNAGRLRAAVLDVFTQEPLPADHPFWRTEHLHLTPHIAAFTPEDAIARLFADNLGRRRRGERLVGEVDPAAGY
ncbi:MAG: NAD(P)-dependent oxidoreductase [Pseudomonadota bacterium]